MAFETKDKEKINMISKGLMNEMELKEYISRDYSSVEELHKFPNPIQYDDMQLLLDDGIAKPSFWTQVQSPVNTNSVGSANESRDQKNKGKWNDDDGMTASIMSNQYDKEYLKEVQKGRIEDNKGG
jgi:hypothetical protein